MSGDGTNRQFATHDERFRASCAEAGIPATKRQAGKFRRKVGSAFRVRRYQLAILPLDIKEREEEFSRLETKIRKQERVTASLSERPDDDEEHEAAWELLNKWIRMQGEVAEILQSLQARLAVLS